MGPGAQNRACRTLVPRASSEAPFHASGSENQPQGAEMDGSDQTNARPSTPRDGIGRVRSNIQAGKIRMETKVLPPCIFERTRPIPSCAVLGRALVRSEPSISAP